MRWTINADILTIITKVICIGTINNRATWVGLSKIGFFSILKLQDTLSSSSILVNYDGCLNIVYI